MPLRVLVVEDNEVNLELTVALLEQLGCAVVTAAAADEGLRRAAAERPDLILMDVQLPGLTGYDATRALKADPHTAGIPVVALTAHAMQGEEARARAAGCAGYLTKPVTLQMLRDALQDLLPRGATAG